ncbi:MAG: GCAxxG family protein [Deferribacteraceae bacterium]|jgi:C_GCAxxG_C_C family probable redox protein|nr:GCAxxG family protein [Deferribacteraceae bacterium]
MIDVKSIEIEKLRIKAESYFKEGYYCSEAVVKAFEDVTGVRFSDDFKKSMAILGEGIGGQGCICGAVSASILILGRFTGRLNVYEDKQQSQKAGKLFIERFKEKYKTTCCKSLTKRSEMIFGIGKFKHCPQITSFCAVLLLEILSENNLLRNL